MVTPLEQNFQPQTRDTTNGPHLHTYIPRSDGSILVGGVAYIPQVTNIGATATTVPIGGVTAVPVATQPVVQPFSPYPANFPYYIYGQPASFPASFSFLFSRISPSKHKLTIHSRLLPRPRSSTNNLLTSLNLNPSTNLSTAYQRPVCLNHLSALGARPKTRSCGIKWHVPRIPR